MKILLVYHSFYPVEGGVSTSLYYLSRSLQLAGHEVSVFTSSYQLCDELKKQFDIKVNQYNCIDNIKVYYQQYPGVLKSSIKAFLWLMRNTKKFDVVFLNSFFSRLSLIAAIPAVIYRKPFSIAPHGELAEKALAFKRRKKAFWFPIYNAIYKKSAYFVAGSQLEEGTIKKIIPNKDIKLIPCLLDFSGENENLEVKNIKQKKNIIFLGRINPIKNIDLLIKAYQKLPQHVQNIHQLNIVGGADNKAEEKYLQQLKKLASENINIHFLGFKVGAEKMRLLADSKVLVLPSQTENFGMVVIEAMAQATPVIVSSNTPWAAYSTDQGVITVKSSLQELQSAMQYVFNINEHTYIDLCRKAYCLASNNYSYDKQAVNINKVLFGGEKSVKY